MAFLNQNSNFGLFFLSNVNTWNPLPLCSILGTADLVPHLLFAICGLVNGTADLVPHLLFAICGLVDEDAETMMGSV